MKYPHFDLCSKNLLHENSLDPCLFRFLLRIEVIVFKMSIYFEIKAFDVSFYSIFYTCSKFVFSCL